MFPSKPTRLHSSFCRHSYQLEARLPGLRQVHYQFRFAVEPFHQPPAYRQEQRPLLLSEDQVVVLRLAYRQRGGIQLLQAGNATVCMFSGEPGKSLSRFFRHG